MTETEMEKMVWKITHTIYQGGIPDDLLISELETAVHEHDFCPEMGIYPQYYKLELDTHGNVEFFQWASHSRRSAVQINSRGLGRPHARIIDCGSSISETLEEWWEEMKEMDWVVNKVKVEVENHNEHIRYYSVYSDMFFN